MSKKQKKGLRNIHITSTISMALVLFLVGLVSTLLFLAHDAAVYVKENITLSVILEDGINTHYEKRIENFLKTSPYTKSVSYISKEDALKDHIQSLGENPEKFLGYNPLQASLEVNLKAEYANNDSVKMIESKLAAFEYIDKVAYQKDMVSLVNDNVKKISMVLLGLAVVLLLVSMTLINNTIKLSVYSNRFIINTMKLVGATSWFIRKPYVRSGIINGCIAAFLSVIMLGMLVLYVQYEFGLTGMLLQPMSVFYVIFIVFVSGILLTAASSYMSVGKYLKKSTNDLYLV